MSEPSGPSPNFIAGDVYRLAAPTPTGEQRHRAALIVASAAGDADDCRTLLDMLGLDPHEGTQR